jgi:hypothetical protein
MQKDRRSQRQANARGQHSFNAPSTGVNDTLPYIFSLRPYPPISQPTSSPRPQRLSKPGNFPRTFPGESFPRPHVLNLPIHISNSAELVVIQSFATRWAASSGAWQVLASPYFLRAVHVACSACIATALRLFVALDPAVCSVQCLQSPRCYDWGWRAVAAGSVWRTSPCLYTLFMLHVVLALRPHCACLRRDSSVVRCSVRRVRAL